MSSLTFLYVTAPDKGVAEALGRALVEQRLCACVNILPGIRSIYRWEGQIEADEEVAIIVKTRTDLTAAVTEAVKKIHPYDVPCIVSLPVADDAGNREFLDWIKDQATGDPT